MKLNTKNYLCLITILSIMCQPAQALNWPFVFSNRAISSFAIIAASFGSYSIWKKYNAPVEFTNKNLDLEKRLAFKKAIIDQANSKPFFNIDWLERVRKKSQENADLKAQAAAREKAAVERQIFKDRELARSLDWELNHRSRKTSFNNLATELNAKKLPTHANPS